MIINNLTENPIIKAHNLMDIIKIAKDQDIEKTRSEITAKENKINEFTELANFTRREYNLDLASNSSIRSEFNIMKENISKLEREKNYLLKKMESEELSKTYPIIDISFLSISRESIKQKFNYEKSSLVQDKKKSLLSMFSSEPKLTQKIESAELEIECGIPIFGVYTLNKNKIAIDMDANERSEEFIAQINSQDYIGGLEIDKNTKNRIAKVYLNLIKNATPENLELLFKERKNINFHFSASYDVGISKEVEKKFSEAKKIFSNVFYVAESKFVATSQISVMDPLIIGTKGGDYPFHLYDAFDCSILEQYVKETYTKINNN